VRTDAYDPVGLKKIRRAGGTLASLSARPPLLVRGNGSRVLDVRVAVPRGLSTGLAVPMAVHSDDRIARVTCSARLARLRLITPCCVSLTVAVSNATTILSARITARARRRWDTQLVKGRPLA
jgi:hypothetical protein